MSHRDGDKYLPNYSNKEAEILFEGPELDITYHVHDTLFVFWVAVFYLPMLPVGILGAFFAFACNFMFLKYKLLTSHKSPRNIDQKLAKFVVLCIPWMIYFASFMQLFYVRQAVWYMKFINKSKGNVPLRLEDIEYLKLCSFWFFVAMSAYMILPVRRIISEIEICCKKFNARPNTK